MRRIDGSRIDGRRSVVRPAVQVAVAAVAVSLLAAACGSSHQATPSTTGPSGTGSSNPSTGPTVPTTTPPVTSASTLPPATAGIFDVVRDGADPTGARDSSAAIRHAIASAEQTAGSTVSFPAGRYLLDDPSGGMADFRIATNPINIKGAGAATTTIVEKSGAMNGRTVGKVIFQIQSAPQNQPGGADGTTVTGLTLDSASFDGGTPILDTANRTTISDDVIHGPRSSHDYNRGQFGVRVIAICNHDNLAVKHRSNNTLSNLTITGQGSAGNTDLDLSCQENATVSNITDTGNGMDIYIANQVTVNGLTFRPGSAGRNSQPYFITGPTDGITLNDIVTYGSGGKLQASPSGYSINGTTINRERMLGGAGFVLSIGDADGTSIVDSTITGVKVSPMHARTGLSFTNSTVGRTSCGGAGTMAAMSGTHC